MHCICIIRICIVCACLVVSNRRNSDGGGSGCVVVLVVSLSEQKLLQLCPKLSDFVVTSGCNAAAGSWL